MYNTDAFLQDKVKKKNKKQFTIHILPRSHPLT